MEKIKNVEKILFVITLLVLTIIMFYWINQKEGFHEDEIFSYGSSNYSQDNVFQRYGSKDEVNQIIFDKILVGDLSNVTNNILNYLNNPNLFMQEYNDLVKQEKPIWKTKEEAKEYLTINDGDTLNFFSVYYNQSRDVHPPLFYFVVHIVSSICFGTFSKYIIFAINLIFFILSCLILRKILILLDRRHLTIPLMILYGFSIGAISTVIFLRMYQMLVFFTLLSLYLHIKIIKNDYDINRKTRNELIVTTILGFLTQYYFCIFAFLEFIVLTVILVKKKKYDVLKKYIKYHIMSAIIGIIIFPASIYHIFFSYRGMGADIKVNLLESIITYINELGYSFSMSGITLILIFAIISIILSILIIKKDRKRLNIPMVSIILIPTLLFFVVISIIAPQMASNTLIRYIAIVIPLVGLILILAIDYILKEKLSKNAILMILTVFVLIWSVYGLVTNYPRYLYKGYNQILDIAKNNSELNYVYICDNNFTYLSALPEFMVYDKTKIININIDNLELLKSDEELKTKKEFVLCIKKWLDCDEVLNDIMEYTGFDDFELLADSEDLEALIYKLMK